VSGRIIQRVRGLTKLEILLGIAVLAAALAVAPMPLMVDLPNTNRGVMIFPNLLFAVPMLLLGALLLLYGATTGDSKRPGLAA
jgi:peptidoglycan/LPS O-acetylase OafA/YrhL